MKANSASNISALLLSYLPINPVWAELGEKPAVEVVISKFKEVSLEGRSNHCKRKSQIPTRRLPYRLVPNTIGGHHHHQHLHNFDCHLHNFHCSRPSQMSFFILGPDLVSGANC